MSKPLDTLKIVKHCMLSTAFLCLFSASAVAEEKPVVELNHWWVSPGELAAVAELKKEIEKRGGVFESSSLDNFDEFRTSIIERISLGYLPAATHWLGGSELLQLKNQNILLPLPDKVGNKKVKDILFNEVLTEITSKGELAALPVGIHLQNTVYYNAKIYNSLNLTPPTTWDEFNKQAEIIQKAGHTPLAIASDPWQLRFLADALLLSKGGEKAFLDIFNPKIPVAGSRDLLIDTFRDFLTLKPFTDKGAAKNKWNDNVNAVAKGEAAAQFMGDFAKGELLEAKLEPGKDFFCEMAPGNQGIMLYGVDVFALLKVDDDVLKAGQDLLVNTVLDQKVQGTYISKKGGIPVRKDVDISNLDACAAKMYASWSSPQNAHVSIPAGNSRARMTMYQNTAHAIWTQKNPDIEKEIDTLIEVIDHLAAK